MIKLSKLQMDNLKYSTSSLYRKTHLRIPVNATFSYFPRLYGPRPNPGAGYDNLTVF